MSERWISITRWAAPGTFLLLASLWIGRPGPGPDEALFAQALFPDLPGGPAWRAPWFGLDLPVMLMPYLGALKAWLYAPVPALLGTGPAALRLPAIALGAVTLLLFFEWTRRWAGGAAAVWTAWLLATDGAFLWTTRCDWGPAALQRLLGVGGCLLVWQWSRSGARWRLFAGFFLFGLGLFDKLTFHWLLIGHAAALALVFRREALARIRPAVAALALAGLALGAAPYVAYRLQSPPQGPPLELETDAERYRQKWGMLLKALDGTVARGFMIASTAPAPEGGPELREGDLVSLFPWAVLAAVLLLPWTNDKTVRYSAAFCAAALAAMAPLRDAGSVHHQALLWPFPQLLVGAALAWHGARPGLRRFALGFGGTLLLSNVMTLGVLYRDALRLGGAPYWSEAAYELADDLRRRRPRLAVALDWGLDNPQRFLLAHDPPVQPLVFPWDWDDRGTVERLEAELRQGGVVFLVRANAAERLHPETRQAAEAAAERAGVELLHVRTIEDRHGRRVFDILEARPVNR